MPQRVVHLVRTITDWSVFGTSFGLLGALWSGITISEWSTLMAGAGALLLGIARAAKYIADARLTMAEAKIKETYVDPDVFHMLEQYKCWNAVDCPTREIFRPERMQYENE